MCPQGRPDEQAMCALTQGPKLRRALPLISCPAVSALMVLMIFKQGLCVFILNCLLQFMCLVLPESHTQE